MYVVSEIIYANPILNHPKLLTKILKHFTLNEVLNLSSDVSRDLINEAIISNNYELLLAGLISINNNVEI